MKKRSALKKILLLSTLNLYVFLSFPSKIFAQAVTCTEFLCDPHNALCGVICQIVPQIPAFFVGGGVIVAIVFMAFYGIQFITAGDDVKKIQNAKGGLTWATVGLVLLIIAFVVFRFAAAIIGADPNEIFVIQNVANCNC